MKRSYFKSHFWRNFIFVHLSLSFAYAEVNLGGMESWGFNGIRSGQVSLMSPNKLKIRGLDYTGEGPAVWFMVGKEPDPYNEEFAELTGTIIPDENGSCDKLQRYRNENVVLTLPKGMNFTDYDYLAIYCIRFNHNFGFVQLKRASEISPEQMNPMEQDDLPKPCPQDHLEDEEEEGEEEKEEEEEEEEDEERRRRKRRKSISGYFRRKSSSINNNRKTA